MGEGTGNGSGTDGAKTVGGDAGESVGGHEFIPVEGNCRKGVYTLNSAQYRVTRRTGGHSKFQLLHGNAEAAGPAGNHRCAQGD